MVSEELLASLGSLSCKCWSLAAHIGQNSQSAWQSITTGSSSHQEGWAERPQGPLLWFHALTLGETAVVLPVVFRCLLEYNEHVHVLLTTKSAEAIALLSSSLPPRVIVQDVPLDSYLSMARFLDHFQPQACILMESPAWPVLVESCAGRGIRLGLLNARMSSRAFLSWFQPRVSRALLRRMMGSFSLVVPQSDIDVGRFRIFGATLTQMPGWCSDLKYAAALGNSVWHLWRPKPSRIASLRSALCGRPIWVAAHTQPGEEEAVATVHAQSAKDWPSLLTVLAPAAAGRSADVAEMLQSQHGLKVLVWSSVVDILAPQASKQQQQQQQQQQHVISSSSWIQAWRSTGTSRAADGQQQQQQQEPAAAAAAGSSGNSASSSSVGAVDPAMLLKGVDVLLLDLLADLPLMYSVSEVAFIGNSLLEGCSGHNLAEAAVAGCAVLIGEHAGHFSTMADELNQAAVVAAEEASAAVNSSGPMEDPFFAAAAAAAAVDSGSGSAGAAGPSTSGAGGHAGHEHPHAAVVEGAESEEPSPRDGSHWRGVLNYTQHDDEQYGQYTDGSTGGGSRDGFSSVQQPQQHQQLQQLLQQQQLSLRPSSAPAAVANTSAAAGGSSGSTLGYMQPPVGTRAAAPTPDSSSGGGGVYGLPGARNTAALLYRRQGRTGSSANSSCVSSPVASQRPSTAGGSAYGQPASHQQQQQQQQQHAMSAQQPQQQQQQEQQERRQQEGYLQQYHAQVQQQRQQQAHQQQQRGTGTSPLLEPANPQQQQQQQQGDRAAASPNRDASTSGGGGGCCGECGPAQRCPAVDRPVPQAPPPSAASNTPVNGPTGTVTPITPAGSFGGADPALLQQPDSRDLALRLAQQQQQQGAAGTQRPRESDPLQQQQQQQQQGGGKQPQDSSSSSSSAGGAQQQPHANYPRLSGNSSSGGGAASNAASTPLSCVADLYSMPFPRSPRALVLPDTPHPTPEDSAHTMGGRSPMISGAGVGVTYTPDLAALQLQHPSKPPSAEPSWQSAATSNGSDGGCLGSNGGAAGSNGGAAGSSGRSSACQEAGAAVDCQAATQSDVYGSNGTQQQQQEADHPLNASLLQRPACPSPPEAPCFSRASATSTVSNMPVFSSSSSSGGPAGRSSRSRLGRTVSSGGWQEEQQRQRHRQHLQGVVNGVWRGGSEGGSPMVAAILEASAAAEDSCSSDEDDYQGGDDGRRGPAGRVCGPGSAHAHASPAGSTAAAGSGDGASVANGVAEEDVLAASLSGGCMGRLSAESSGLFDSTAGGAEDGEGCSDSGNEDAVPFSRSPTFAELAACGRGSSNGGSSGTPAPHSVSGSGGGSKAPNGHGPSSETVGPEVGTCGGAVGSHEGSGAHVSSSNDSSMAGGTREAYVPDLCPSERHLQLQQQQQLARLTSDQGSVGWEDWGQHHQQQHRDGMQQQALSQPPLHCNGLTAGLSSGGGSSNWQGIGPGSEDPHARGASPAAAAAGPAAAAAAAPPAVAAMRSSDGGGATSRLGDPRRSRRWQDLPSEGSSPVAAAAEIQPATHPQLHHQAPNAQQLQSLHQPQLLSYSGAGSAAAVLVGGGGAGAPLGNSTGGTGGLHSSSSGGGGGVWLDPQSGMSTPASWGATPRAAPQQQQQPQQQHWPGSTSNTPSASVTPRGVHRGAPGMRAGASSSHSSHHGHHSSSNSSSQHNWQHHQQQQVWQNNPTGRRSADIQQQQFLDGGSSGGGSGMFYPMPHPLSRIVGDSGTYRRAESVTSMTSFTTSVGGDLMLHDDLPGSSRMSLIGENSSHLGYSTTGGRFSGFTGGAFASTGRFSECATPRSTVTDVFRGQSEGEAVSAGGDAGALLNPGTSYLRYRGEYILPATQLPASPQGPAVWRVSGAAGLSVALNNLLQEPLERRSRGHAAAQAAAKLASGLVSTVWHVVDDMVVTPALQDYVAQGGLAGDAAAQHAARAPRIPGHPRI